MNLYSTVVLKAGVFVFLFIVLAAYFQPGTAAETNGWKKDWSLKEGFDLNIDTEGYNFPAAIAFVPDPGKGPKDPLYFVTELRGKVKVVTNDRTVHTFAENFFELEPDRELPDFSGEIGLAGICLDPANGYVFVTFAYQDEDKILHNNIARFDTEPGTFSLQPGSMTAFTDVFSREDSSPSHQIGPCQVYDGMLYVSVGDGSHSRRSRKIDSILGKILRMTLDGKPVRSNPYYVDDDVTKARNYVWAAGLRNPFGLMIVDGRVFVADNGPSVDRFIEVREGEDYLWDGSDASIATNADALFVPAVGVTGLTYFPKHLDIVPEEYRGRFYLDLCGDPDSDPLKSSGRGIVELDYGFDRSRLLSPPEMILRYKGKSFQTLVGLAVGPDGLYFTPILPLEDGRSVVFKISYDPGSKHPYTPENETDATLLIEQNGCYGCHKLNEKGWGTAGPRLDRDRLVPSVSDRLRTDEYAERINEIDRLETEPYKSYRDERAEVLGKKGIDKIRAWVKYHIMEPKFDNPDAAMPNLGIDSEKAELITLYLVPDAPDLRSRLWLKFHGIIPELRYRHLVYSFLLGAAITLLIAGGYALIRR